MRPIEGDHFANMFNGLEKSLIEGLPVDEYTAQKRQHLAPGIPVEEYVEALRAYGQVETVETKAGQKVLRYTMEKPCPLCGRSS